MSLIFKKNIDFNKDILYNFLNQYCIYQENKYFILDKVSFKKYLYNDKIREFYDIMKTLYKINKLFYLDREITFKNFITIIRHICKYFEITYQSSIKYNKSKYEIIYYIYI